MQAKVLSWWGSRLGGSAAITASSTPPRRGVSAAAAGPRVATTNEPVSRARIMAEKKAIGTSCGTVESVARTGRSRPRKKLVREPSRLLRSRGAPRARRAGRLSRHQRAGKRGRLRPVLGEEAFEALERAIAPGQTDAVDGKVVDQTRVEVVLGVAAVRARHARRRLLRDLQLRAERPDELAHHRLVAQLAGDFGEAREERINRHRPRRRAAAVFQIARQTDLHADTSNTIVRERPS